MHCCRGIGLKKQRERTEAFIEESLQLKQSEVDTVKWKVVVGHHPVVTIGEHYGEY